MKATTLCNNATLATKSRTAIGQRIVMLLALVTLLGLSGRASFAQSLSDIEGSGSVRFVTGGISTFTLTGTNSLLNRFTCGGELRFTSGNLLTGELSGIGVAVFRAANGDQLVATVAIQTGSQSSGTSVGKVALNPVYSVRLSNGMIVYSTGQFKYSLPDPVVKTVNTDIIGILMGLLVPAVKK